MPFTAPTLTLVPSVFVKIKLPLISTTALAKPTPSTPFNPAGPAAPAAPARPCGPCKPCIPCGPTTLPASIVLPSVIVIIKRPRPLTAALVIIVPAVVSIVVGYQYVPLNANTCPVAASPTNTSVRPSNVNTGSGKLAMDVSTYCLVAACKGNVGFEGNVICPVIMPPLIFNLPCIAANKVVAKLGSLLTASANSLRVSNTAGVPFNRP